MSFNLNPLLSISNVLHQGQTLSDLQNAHHLPSQDIHIGGDASGQAERTHNNDNATGDHSATFA